uniref:Uncharacterized protein n=1 Tax=Oryza nivara TaxID=4536 RepID=A0A0E0ISQ1_ORYNI
MRSAAGIWMAHGAGRATTGDLVGEGSGGKKPDGRDPICSTTNTLLSRCVRYFSFMCSSSFIASLICMRSAGSSLEHRVPIFRIEVMDAIVIPVMLSGMGVFCSPSSVADSKSWSTTRIEIREAFQTPKLDGDVSCKVVAPETDDLEALTGCQCRRDLPTDGVAAEVEVLELREAPEL